MAAYDFFRARLDQMIDLRHPLAVAGAGISPAGRPRLLIRLMVALLHLKHAYNDSHESVVVCRSQGVYLQFFNGQV